MALKIFFGLLTIFLVSCLVIYGICSRFKWRKKIRRVQGVENESREHLLNAQVMTIGIILFCGIYFFSLSRRIFLTIDNLISIWPDYWILTSLILNIFFAILMVFFIFKAPDLLRILGDFESGWGRNDKLFRKYLVAVLMVFSGSVLLTDFPLVIVGIFKHASNHPHLANSWFSSGFDQGPPGSEIWLSKSFILILLALLAVRYRNPLSALLAFHYGDPSKDE